MEVRNDITRKTTVQKTNRKNNGAENKPALNLFCRLSISDIGAGSKKHKTKLLTIKNKIMKTESTNLENSYIGSADGRDVYTYRNSENNPLSICILSDEPFSVEDAWDTLMEVYPNAESKNIVFIEFDKGVAMNYNSQYAAVFHEYNLNPELLETSLSFTREEYEEKRDDGIVSFDDFLKNIIETVIEEGGTFEDAVFIAEDAFLKSEEDAVRTYDVRFNDEEDSNSKGFRESFEYCKQYIEMYNGSNHSYFADYKGGTVSIVCNETGETIYEEEIK